MKASVVPAPRAVHDTGRIFQLRQFALEGLIRMYNADERIFYFCLRRTSRGVVPEGHSIRYTAIALFGLATEAPEAVHRILAGQSLHEVCESLANYTLRSGNLGDVALTLWAATALGYKERSKIWDHFWHLDPLNRPHPVVELAWALDAAGFDPDHDRDNLSAALARRLKQGYSPSARTFPHVVGSGGSRSHVSCFADMVYPIHALSRYAKRTGDAEALTMAADCARMICERQGPHGQWWWHYDHRTGAVIEGYPVYAIHQDAMAPMALFALRDAGGPDFSREIQKGLDWLFYAPEIVGSLIDGNEGLIWRKVARREPGKLSRYLQAAASIFHPSLRIPGLDSLLPPRSVDYEDRPYHLGWLLYAWPAHRTDEWDRRSQHR